MTTPNRAREDRLVVLNRQQEVDWWVGDGLVVVEEGGDSWGKRA